MITHVAAEYLLHLVGHWPCSFCIRGYRHQALLAGSYVTKVTPNGVAMAFQHVEFVGKIRL